ncbi:hypothetical protein REPUB_Repub10bG0089500 [Reevesia pubescens]
MNVERSHQSHGQNASHSSSSPTLSQSDNGGEGLSPSDDDDASGAADFSGHVGDNMPYSPLGREYGHDATHGIFIDMSDYARIPTFESSGARTERRSQSKGKGKKHQHDNSGGSSSFDRRSNSSNFGYSESSANTQGYYPPRPPSNFQPHDYLPSHGYFQPHPSSFLVILCLINS